MDQRAPPPYWALPLLALWANLHGSVVLALGLIGPAVLEGLLDEKRSEWPRALLRWLPFTALAVAACCLTPYGPGPLLIPLTTLSAGHALNWISEWRPQDFGHVGSFELLLLAGIFALSRGVTLPVVRALVVLGLIHFALAQVRNADLLAMLAPLYLAAPLARQLGRQIGDDTAGSARSVNLAALAVMIVATGLALGRDVRPFIGRYNRDVSLADLRDFLRLLDQYKFDATLLEPGTPAVALLDRLPDWQRVYGDDVAVVHKRRDAPKK